MSRGRDCQRVSTGQLDSVFGESAQESMPPGQPPVADKCGWKLNTVNNDDLTLFVFHDPGSLQDAAEFSVHGHDDDTAGV